MTSFIDFAILLLLICVGLLVCFFISLIRGSKKGMLISAGTLLSIVTAIGGSFYLLVTSITTADDRDESIELSDLSRLYLKNSFDRYTIEIGNSESARQLTIRFYTYKKIVITEENWNDLKNIVKENQTRNRKIYFEFIEWNYDILGVIDGSKEDLKRENTYAKRRLN